jgi:hypothetical protein
MAYNSSGVFSRLYDWTVDRDNGVKIRADRMDGEFDGIVTALTTALLKDGTQTATAIIPFAVGLSIIDNQSAIFGTNSDYTLQYDEATRDALMLTSNVEGAAFKLTLSADQGDDASDEWQVGISTGGVFTIGNDINSAQTYVAQLTLTPNATVANSTTAVAGNLTVGGSLSLGSAAITEAELEMLDGITAGTVIASKAIVTDSDKDITGGRNITITGELDAATGDFSGDVDVDGTLEADAITVNGTALATVIAGTTVTNATNAVNATNSAHVLVTDNESTNEENLIAFVEGATSSTGNVGLEMDGNFAYNPSTGTVSATVFKGNIDAVDGDFDGTLEADAITIGGTAVGSIFSPIAGGTGILTTGALDTGSITSGFGIINNGASAITTTGVGSFGSLDISGDIDVDGTTNLDVVDIDGAVDMASSLTVAGAFTSLGIDDNANATAITIDSSENVLVGKTNQTANVAGTEIEGSGTIVSTRASNTNLFLNRTGNDGDLINFRKDNTILGSIQSRAGSMLSIALNPSGSDGAGFTGGSNAVLPATATAISDNAIDLGVGSYRYKDIYLSGGAFLGGTGTANKLEDYEEGTWTATLDGSTSGPSTAVTVAGTYTKIGNMCYAQFQLSNVNTTGAAGGVRITGLPFTASGAQSTGNVMTYVRFTLGTGSTNISPYAEGTQISFYQSTSNAGWSEIAHNAGTGAYLSASVFYKTT